MVPQFRLNAYLVTIRMFDPHGAPYCSVIQLSLPRIRWIRCFSRGEVHGFTILFSRLLVIISVYFVWYLDRFYVIHSVLLGRDTYLTRCHVTYL